MPRYKVLFKDKMYCLYNLPVFPVKPGVGSVLLAGISFLWAVSTLILLAKLQTVINVHHKLVCTCCQKGFYGSTLTTAVAAFIMLSGYLSDHPILMNVISQEHLEGVSSNLAKKYQLGLKDEMIRFWCCPHISLIFTNVLNQGRLERISLQLTWTST